MRATFTEKIKRTETVKSFRFSCEGRTDFIPGQFTQLIFDEKDRANRTLNKYLSFSCAPGKEYIEVTKRISESEFSKRLDGLKEGEEVLFAPPMGNCVFKEDYEKIAFLIGGIGVTPVISMIEYIVERKMDTDACLLYSNRSADEAAFKKELDAWTSRAPGLRIIHKTGRIDKDAVVQHLPDRKERVIFMFGPPAMVGAMKDICLVIGCAKDMLKTENFIGY